MAKKRFSEESDDSQIDVTKALNCTLESKKNNGDYKKSISLIDMQRDMEEFFACIRVDNQSFKEEEAFKALMKYIENHNRILYSTVSHIVYDIAADDASGKTSSNSDRFGTLLSNIEKVVAYVDDDENISKHVNATNSENDKKIVYDSKKAVWKIWDHVNLAHRQYEELKQSDSEYDDKFQQRIVEFKTEISTEISAQLLSIVGIFTALAFVIFGGISSLQNVLSGLKESHLLRLLIVGCGWGIGMMNAVFVFLFCIGKMVKLNLKSSQSPDATFCQRYPVFCWSNFILVSFLVIVLWVYYCLNLGSISWLDCLMSKHPKIVSGGGLAIIFVLVLCSFYKLLKKSKLTVGNEDD